MIKIIFLLIFLDVLIDCLVLYIWMKKFNKANERLKLEKLTGADELKNFFVNLPKEPTMGKIFVIVNKTDEKNPSICIDEKGKAITFEKREEAAKFKKLSGLEAGFEVTLV